MERIGLFQLPWRALEVAATAAECLHMDDVRQHLLPTLAAVTGAHLAIYHQMSTTGNLQEYGVVWPDENSVASALAAYPGVMHESPLLQHFMTTGTLDPVSVSQLLSRRQWHVNPVYRESHRHLGAEDHLALVLGMADGVGHAITLCRSGAADFDEGDRSLLALAEPHVRAALRRCLRSDGVPGSGDGADPSLDLANRTRLVCENIRAAHAA